MHVKSARASSSFSIKIQRLQNKTHLSMGNSDNSAHLLCSGRVNLIRICPGVLVDAAATSRREISTCETSSITSLGSSCMGRVNTQCETMLTASAFTSTSWQRLQIL